jgi:hypothetical protein
VPGAKPGGVETLRAIPWVFAWTQTRLHLPAWLGVGDALQAAMADPSKAAVIRDMYRSWPWWRELVDLLDMVLSKGECGPHSLPPCLPPSPFPPCLPSFLSCIGAVAVVVDSGAACRCQLRPPLAASGRGGR